VAAQRRAEVVDISVRLNAVIPERDLLTDLTGDRQRNLAVALAGGGVIAAIEPL